MIKLFRKLTENCVMMYIDYDATFPDVAHVAFRHHYGRCMRRMVNLSEFTDVWGGDHVLENVLESWLDELLEDIKKDGLEISLGTATDGGENT